MKVVTAPNCEKMNEILNDLTISSAGESPKSPLNKQFNHTYLDESFGNFPESRGKNIWHKTLVCANKRERHYEKDVHNYFLNKVLNQNNLSKITGLTTKADLENQKKQLKLKLQRQAKKEAEKLEAML